MFTIEQIETAHSKVKTGADFPKYIQEIKSLGVTAFETWVKDSHTEYFGTNGFSTSSKPMYDDLNMANSTNKTSFEHALKIHQHGETNYPVFCEHCAETGVEKWFADLNKMTCTYYDVSRNEVLTEKIPH